MCRAPASPQSLLHRGRPRRGARVRRARHGRHRRRLGIHLAACTLHHAPQLRHARAQRRHLVGSRVCVGRAGSHGPRARCGALHSLPRDCVEIQPPAASSGSASASSRASESRLRRRASLAASIFFSRRLSSFESGSSLQLGGSGPSPSSVGAAAGEGSSALGGACAPTRAYMHAGKGSRASPPHSGADATLWCSPPRPPAPPRRG